MNIVFITDWEGTIFKERPQLILNLFRRWIVVDSNSNGDGEK